MILWKNEKENTGKSEEHWMQRVDEMQHKNFSFY